MKKQLSLFAIWIVLYAQILPAQQPGQVPAPADNRLYTINGIRGFLQRYQVQDVEPINMRNSNRMDSLVRAGRLYLSLQDAIALTLENNLDIEVQRYGPRLAAADLMRAEAGGLIRGIPTTLSTTTTNVANQVSSGGGLGTSVGAGASGTSGSASTGGVVFSQSGTTIPTLETNIVTGYGFSHRTTINSNSFSTGVPAFSLANQSPFISIQRGFLTGTNLSLDFNNSYVRSTVPRAEINPYYTSNLGFTVSQSLLRGFGRSVNSRNIRVAKKQVNLSDLVFVQQVQTTVASVINIYWDLVSYNQDVEVKRKALSLAQKLLEDNKKQVEIGTLAPIEIVRAEAEVARNQQDVTVSETRLLQQETVLKNVISRTGPANPIISEARIVPTDSIRIPENEQIRPIQDLVSTALDKRPDVAQTRLNIETAKISLEGSKSALKPDLSFQGQMRNNGLAGTGAIIPVPGTTNQFQSVANPYFVGGFSDVLGQLFRRNFPDYTFSFQLTIPVSNKTARADMANDFLRLRQSELREQALKNQIRVDVQNALIALQQARATYQSALKSRVFAEQTLDAEQKKYALGASTIFLVIQAQRDLAVAQGAELTSLSSYSRAKVSLDQALGMTLETNNISIDEAKKGQVARPPTTVPMGDK